MSWTLVGVIGLTVANAVMIGWIVRRVKLPGMSWRRAFAEAPVPMMGIASSYGVYAFNLVFMPWWAAMIVAAAYESVYIGIPSLDNLTPEQVALAGKLASAAGWVSFAQNGLAGLEYAWAHFTGQHLVKLLIDNAAMYISLPLVAALAGLHAAQVWVNYHYVKLVHQRHRAPVASQQPQAATGATVPLVKVSTLPPRRPASLRRTMPQLPPPVPVNLGNVAKKSPRTVSSGEYDTATVDGWIAMNDDKMSYRAISLAMGGKPSHTIIGQQIKARRAELAGKV